MTMVLRNGRFQFVVLGLLLAGFTAQPCTAQSATYATLYSFSGGTDGALPEGGVTIGKSGALYGATYFGGSNGLGTAFKLTLAGKQWTETVLYDFAGGADGANPAADLVVRHSGAFYGTTTSGGSSGGGTVFELVPSETGAWTERVLYAFESNYAAPQGAVLIGSGGTLYTTVISGAAVAVTPPSAPGGNWTGAVISSLGGQPYTGLVSQGGALFGTTFNGGDDNIGAVYQLAPPAAAGDAWRLTTLHSFGTTPSDGGGPSASLTIGKDGVLYGTTFYGGSGTPCFYSSGCGTVFQMTPPAAPGGSWTETVLYSFTGQNGDGAYTYGPVVPGKNGVLYGTTEFGGNVGSCRDFYGVPGCGTVFQLTPPAAPGGAWTETVLHQFTGQNSDGALPEAPLALGSNGQLYGTTTHGGATGNGTVFVVNPN